MASLGKGQGRSRETPVRRPYCGIVRAGGWELPCREQAVDRTTEPAWSEGPLQPLPSPLPGKGTRGAQPASPWRSTHAPPLPAEWKGPPAHQAPLIASLL